MIIDVNKLKQQGKTEEQFTFRFVSENSLIDLPGAKIDGEMEVEATVYISGRKAYVEGNVRYIVKGECSRCLEDATKTVEEPFTAEYGMTHEEEYPIKSGLIDLTAPVEEAVMLSCPMVIYCKEDCKGVCPNCGANLNKQNCNCKN